MTVVLNEAGLRNLFFNPEGPVGRRVALKAEEVLAQAKQNSSAPAPGAPTLARESGALNDGLGVTIREGIEGVEAKISTPAVSTWRGAIFSYPAFWDVNGRPWLTDALRTVFPG